MNSYLFTFAFNAAGLTIIQHATIKADSVSNAWSKLPAVLSALPAGVADPDTLISTDLIPVTV